MRDKIECTWGYDSQFSRMLIAHFLLKDGKTLTKSIDQRVDEWFSGFKNSMYEGDVMTGKKVRHWFNSYFEDFGFTEEKATEFTDVLYEAVLCEEKYSVVPKVFNKFCTEFSWLMAYDYLGRYEHRFLEEIEHSLKPLFSDKEQSAESNECISKVLRFLGKIANYKREKQFSSEKDYLERFVINYIKLNFDKEEYEHMKKEMMYKEVNHKTFGRGIIVELDENYATVEFKHKTSQFAFPGAFGKHLTFVDGELNEFIQGILEEKAKAVLIEHDIKPLEQHQAEHPNAKLMLYTDHGTSAQRKYVECCERFGWDICQKNKFGNMQQLYAKGATPEGYSPWFLPHSNLTKSKGGTWNNNVEGNYIFEEWEEVQPKMMNDKTKRVVFVKMGGRYVFYGVYEVQGVELQDNCRYVKTYRRISHVYPIQEL